MIKPKFITFTGIDAHTDPERVKDLSAQYPVEWGILFSASNQGEANRYPSLVDAGRFVDRCECSIPVNFSAHICGRYSNEIMKESRSDSLARLADELGDRYRRTQINVADGETLVHETDIRPRLARYWAHSIGAKDGAIIQCRGDFPNDKDVDWLYDRSGGAGILPASWSANAADSTAFTGYAGGIGPDNVLDVLSKIEAVHPAEKPFWIDMEGNVRTGDWFDLNKCEAVLRAVYG